MMYHIILMQSLWQKLFQVTLNKIKRVKRDPSAMYLQNQAMMIGSTSTAGFVTLALAGGVAYMYYQRNKRNSSKKLSAKTSANIEQSGQKGSTKIKGGGVGEHDGFYVTSPSSTAGGGDTTTAKSGSTKKKTKNKDTSSSSSDDDKSKSTKSSKKDGKSSDGKSGGDNDKLSSLKKSKDNKFTTLSSSKKEKKSTNGLDSTKEKSKKSKKFTGGSGGGSSSSSSKKSKENKSISGSSGSSGKQQKKSIQKSSKPNKPKSILLSKNKIINGKSNLLKDGGKSVSHKPLVDIKKSKNEKSKFESKSKSKSKSSSSSSSSSSAKPHGKILLMMKEKETTTSTKSSSIGDGDGGGKEGGCDIGGNNKKTIAKTIVVKTKNSVSYYQAKQLVSQKVTPKIKIARIKVDSSEMDYDKVRFSKKKK